MWSYGGVLACSGGRIAGSSDSGTGDMRASSSCLHWGKAANATTTAAVPVLGSTCPNVGRSVLSQRRLLAGAGCANFLASACNARNAQTCGNTGRQTSERTLTAQKRWDEMASRMSHEADVKKGAGSDPGCARSTKAVPEDSRKDRIPYAL